MCKRLLHSHPAEHLVPLDSLILGHQPNVHVVHYVRCSVLHHGGLVLHGLMRIVAGMGQSQELLPSCGNGHSYSVLESSRYPLSCYLVARWTTKRGMDQRKKQSDFYMWQRLCVLSCILSALTISTMILPVVLNEPLRVLPVLLAVVRCMIFGCWLHNQLDIPRK